MVFDPSNNVIATLTIRQNQNHIYVMKLPLSATAGDVKTTWVISTYYDGNMLDSAYGSATILDDNPDSSTGYYVLGYYKDENLIERGFFISHISTDGLINWEAFPMHEYDASFIHMSLSTTDSYLWACGVGPSFG